MRFASRIYAVSEFVRRDTWVVCPFCMEPMDITDDNVAVVRNDQLALSHRQCYNVVVDQP